MSHFYINRELSWLKFNQRVLDEIYDETNPPLEKLRFLSIASSNLDEFFMIRVGSLFDRVLTGDTTPDNKSLLTPAQQLEAIFAQCTHFTHLQNKAFSHVRRTLSSYHIHHLDFDRLNKTQRAYIETYFHREIRPLLSPQIVDSKQPFPHLKNRAGYILLDLRRKDTWMFGLVPVSSVLPKMVFVPAQNAICFILTEDILLHYARDLFPSYQTTCCAKMRTVRGGDIRLQENVPGSDMRAMMRDLLKNRIKLSPVRLDISTTMRPEFMAKLLKKLRLDASQIFTLKTPFRFDYVHTLEQKLPKLIRDMLCFVHLSPQLPPWYDERENMITQAEKGDLLLCYPQHSVKPFLHLLRDAASDKSVVSIQITLYRLCDHSATIDLLIDAANHGKQVTAILELRARFDEQNNIDWADRLENAGCRVLYGPPKYKIHSKILLITRKRGGQISYITHLGTGNYNEETAQLYTDLNLITTNKQIGMDGAKLFKNLTTANTTEGNYSCLLVAPNDLKTRLLSMIEREISLHKQYGNGHIIIKCNSLSDKDIIDALSPASCAGVRIDLIVRGICCLAADIKNHTENITVTSIIGRFLEHSRIYYFHNGGEKSVYLSSADLMTRNLSRRIEIAAPIYDNRIKKQLCDMLFCMLRDDVKARNMNQNGDYIRAKPTIFLNSQLYFYQSAYQSAQKRLRHTCSPLAFLKRVFRHKK